MSSGLYASLTPLPFSEQSAHEFISVFGALLSLRTREGRAGEVLDERYAKVGDNQPLTSAMQPGLSATDGVGSMRPIELGSAWVLQCYASHGFHYHSYSEDNELLSFRRLLLCADRGFTVEIYPLNFSTRNAAGPLELFVVNGAALAELEFDGRMVHRFRPLDGGLLYAYSMHALDLSGADDAAATQTFAVPGEGPAEVVEHVLSSPSLADLNSETPLEHRCAG